MVVARASATSNASLQLRCTTPKKLPTRAKKWHDQDDDYDEDVSYVDDVRSSRYRLLDESERAREAEEIARIQRELQAQQRRPRSAQQQRETTTNQTKKVTPRASLVVERRPSSSSSRGRGQEPASPPSYDSYGSRYQATTKSSTGGSSLANSRTKIEPPSTDPFLDGDDDSDGGDQAVAPLPTESSSSSTTTAAFQEQVMEELQKLKQAQQKDLAAIQRLQREKQIAERKAAALEATLRQQQQQQRQPHPQEMREKKPALTTTTTKAATSSSRSRPHALDFGELDDGDFSAPPPMVMSPTSPPQYEQQPTTSYHLEDRELDYTDGEEEVEEDDEDDAESVLAPQKWATSSSRSTAVQQSGSPVFPKPTARQSRPLSARSSRDNGGSLNSTTRTPRPRSARTLYDNTSGSEDDHDDHDSTQPPGKSRDRSSSASSQRGRPTTRGSLTRSRSASRDCAFFEAKQKAQDEEELFHRETQEKLDRAARATPPANLLKRQQDAYEKKQAFLRKLDKQQHAESSPAKRVRAREVPPTTYVASDAFLTNDEREFARKDRVAKRAQQLLAQAELPTRMKMALEQQKQQESCGQETLAMQAMSITMRKKLQEQADAMEKRKQAVKPKPVPNFTHLQHQWEKALSIKKSHHQPTQPQLFFTSREKELELLRAKKVARKQKLLDQEETARLEEVERQRMVLERAKKSSAPGSSSRSSGAADGGAGGGPRLTKSAQLRMKKTQDALRDERRAKEQQEIDKEKAQMKQKEASRRVAAQVRQVESHRKDGYAGDFVDLSSVEELAKEKAKKQRHEFREAVARNKQKLLQAVATKPSLMERFTMDLKREEHKKNALEAVVKQVFHKNFKDMKGILTEEEEELAKDMVAAEENEQQEEEERGEEEEDGDKKKKKKKKKAKDVDSDDEEDE